MIRKPSFQRKLLILIACFGLSALIAGFTFRNYTDQEGYRILVEQGPKAAVQYFSQAKENSAFKNDVSIWYGYAWSNFRDGRYGVAEDYCQRILGNNPNERRRADVYFLLGYIHLDMGRHFMANLRFKDAFELYSRVENCEPNMHRAELGLARVYLDAGNFVEAGNALDRAARYSGKLKSLAEYHAIRTRLAFKLGDYKLALKLARLALTDAKANEIYQANAYINISRYSILLGDYESGQKYFQMAQRLVVKNALDEQAPLNLMNMILLNRCTGEPYDVLVDQVEAHIHKKHDNDFQSLYELVLNWECSNPVN